MNLFHRVRRLPILLAVLLTAGAAQGTDLERQARELEARLIAPCCFTQQVSIHHSPAADEVRRDVRKRLAAGETQDQILDAYVAQYGKRILAEPPAEGIARGLYLLPPLAFVLTAALVVVVVRRFTSSRASGSDVVQTAAAPVEKRYGTELDDQLRDLD